MPNRTIEPALGEKCRYGFNGKENDDEVKGNGSALEFGGRSIYDPRLGRFISIDPLFRSFKHLSPYSFAANNPIFYIDGDGKNPEPSVVVNYYLFNDGVTATKVSFCGCSTSANELEKDFNNGKFSNVSELGESEVHYWIQDPHGNWKELKEGVNTHHPRFEFLNAVPNPEGTEAFKEMVSFIPWVGDGVSVADAASNKQYAMAVGYVALAFIPFDKIVAKGGSFILKRGEKVLEISAKAIWEKNPFIRGIFIESIIAKTTYSAFTHVGVLHNGWWPYFDFIDEAANKAISVKTTNATKGFGSLLKNLEELSTYVINNTTNGGKLIKAAEQHIFVPEGYDQKLLKDVVEKGKELGVTVKIFEFK